MESKHKSSKTKQIAIIVVVALVIIAIIAVLLKVTGVFDAGTSSSSSGGGSSKKTWRIYANDIDFATFDGPRRVNDGDTIVIRLIADEGYPFERRGKSQYYPTFGITYGTTFELIGTPDSDTVVYRISNITGDVSIYRNIVDESVKFSIRFSSDVSAYRSYRNGTPAIFDKYVDAETNLSSSKSSGVSLGATYTYTFSCRSGFRPLFYGAYPDDGEDLDDSASYTSTVYDLGDGRYQIKIFDVDRPLVYVVSAERIDDES